MNKQNNRLKNIKGRVISDLFTQLELLYINVLSTSISKVNVSLNTEIDIEEPQKPIRI